MTKYKTPQQVREYLRKIKGTGKTLRDIADEYRYLTYGDVARALAGIMPAGNEKREDLGLAPLGLAPVCPVCGIVHVSSRCPRKRSFRDLWETPIQVLKWQFENREVIQEGEENGTKEST